MGITIHYSGRIKNTNLIKPLCDEIEDIVKSMGWDFTRLDEDFSKENTSTFKNTKEGVEISGHLPVKGILFYPHEKSEAVQLFFDKNGNLSDIIGLTGRVQVKNELPYVTVKTQYAPAEIHVTIIKLLKYLKYKYFEIFKVQDEGKYWDTGDERLLRKKKRFLASKIFEVSQALSESEGGFGPQDSPIDVTEKIEKIIKARIKRENKNNK